MNNLLDWGFWYEFLGGRYLREMGALVAILMTAWGVDCMDWGVCNCYVCAGKDIEAGLREGQRVEFFESEIKPEEVEGP